MTSTAYPHAGVAVEIFNETQTGQSPAAASQWPDDERTLRNDGILKGRLSVPRTIASDSIASNSPRQVAVTIEPKAAGQNVVQCALAGIVFAYVKILHPSHGYAQIRQIRYNGDAGEVGLLESSESGLIQICGANATDNGGLNIVTAGNIYPLLVKL